MAADAGLGSFVVLRLVPTGPSGVKAVAGSDYHSLALEVSLNAASTRYRCIFPLPRFTYRGGAVAVKVLTSGKPVQRDGLALSRT
jgi:hypothetical protein